LSGFVSIRGRVLTWDEGVSKQGCYDEGLEDLIWNMDGTFGNHSGEEKYVMGFWW